MRRQRTGTQAKTLLGALGISGILLSTACGGVIDETVNSDPSSDLRCEGAICSETSMIDPAPINDRVISLRAQVSGQWYALEHLSLSVQPLFKQQALIGQATLLSDTVASGPAPA